MLALFVVICLFVFLLVIFITQPVLRSNQKNVALDVESALYAHVQFLSQRVNRGHKNPGLVQSAEYIAKQMQQWSQQVSYQEFTVDGQPHKNVVASVGPDTRECIIIGAHYDSFDGLPGADDNASAVAGLLELGRMLSRYQLDINIQLIAYTLEEPPYFRSQAMGSYQHARFVQEQRRPVRLMVCLEMIGYFSDKKDSQRYPLPLLNLLYPRRGDFIALVGGFREIRLIRQLKKAMASASPLAVYSITAPSFIPGIDFSDHRNYWQFNIPAIMVTDTAFYRNPNYHTIHDTLETLDFSRMNQVVNGVLYGVLKIAGR